MPTDASPDSRGDAFDLFILQTKSDKYIQDSTEALQVRGQVALEGFSSRVDLLDIRSGW